MRRTSTTTIHTTAPEMPKRGPSFAIPHALVVVDEAMGAHARQQPIALGLDQRFGREPRRQADEFVPSQAPETLRGAVGVAVLLRVER